MYIYQLIGEVKWTKTWLTIKNGCKGLRWNNPWITRSCKFDLGLLNNVFVTYMISRPFLKGMHISLDSWSPYWDPEGSKQDPDGLIIDYQKIILEVMLRNFWEKLLECPSGGLPQKRVDLRWSEQRKFFSLTYRLMSD